MTGTANKIVLRGISKRFGPKIVLDHLDLNVAAGKSLVVIGASGTGKSVMLKCILGLIRPDAGRIEVDGADTVSLHGQARDTLMTQFGMLFQGGALFDSLKIWENVAFRLIQAQGMEPEAARIVAVEKLRAVGLSESVADLYPAELSGGMQKRVALARAIAGDPKVIFFDEPTTGLDPIMSEVINELIVDCVRDLGATALTITHDMGSVRRIADEVAMIHQGRIVWHGPVADLERTGNDCVDQFIHGHATGPMQLV